MPTKGNPSIVLRDDKVMTSGKQAQLNNIAAARLITEIVRTSLGPRGMDKMLINEYGVVQITNDGAMMLKEMSVLHPAGKVLVELSKTTDTEVGDGTTSAIVLAGALLEKAAELLKRGLHPVQITAGFSKASKHAVEVLRGDAMRAVRDKQTLRAVAKTSLQSKVVANYADYLAGMVADAALTVATEDRYGKFHVNMKSIKVEKKQGGSTADTIFVRGLCLNQVLAHPDMPKRLEKVKIAIYARPFKIEDETLRKKVVIRDPEMVKKFVDGEVKFLKDMVDKVAATGAKLLICQKDMDDVAKQFFARAGIMAVQKAYEYEMPKIADATGAKITHNLGDLTEADLGYAEVVEERKVHNARLLFLEGCRDPKAVTIFIRGGTPRNVEETERSINDALMVAKDTIQEPELLYGGGASEAEAAHAVREWATTLEGREQIAAEAFAEALEQIPTTLAENAGASGLTAMVELRAKHAAGGRSYGIASDGKVRDMKTQGVLEPFVVKRQVITGATEAASMILRVDNIMTARPMGPGPRSGTARPKEMDEPLAE